VPGPFHPHGSRREPGRLIEERSASWKQLAELLSKAENRRGLRRLSRQEIRTLGALYRRTAADVAQLRAVAPPLPGGPADRAAAYLNDLLIRGHAILYRPTTYQWTDLLRFYRFDFPMLLRRHRGYPLTVLAIFLAVTLFSFLATLHDEGFARFCSLTPAVIEQIRTGTPWWEQLREEGSRGAATIIQQNMRVGLLSFGMSVFPIVGTIRILLPSALMFGSLQALILRYEMGTALWSFMIGHLVLEFVAIFIAGGAGLMIGRSIVAPGDRTRRDALIEDGRIAIQLLAGSLPLFLLAGLVEAYLSPLSIPAGYKMILSLGTVAGLLAYLLQSPFRRPGLLQSQRETP